MAAAAAAAVAREVTPGRISAFLSALSSALRTTSESYDPGRLIRDYMSAEANEYARMETRDKEAFFVRFQSMRGVKESEDSAQRVVSCIMTQIRMVEARRSMRQYIIARVAGALPSTTDFSMSLENRIHLRFLLDFQRIVTGVTVTCDTLSGRITALNASKSDLERAIGILHT